MSVEESYKNNWGDCRKCPQTRAWVQTVSLTKREDWEASVVHTYLHRGESPESSL